MIKKDCVKEESHHDILKDKGENRVTYYCKGQWLYFSDFIGLCVKTKGILTSEHGRGFSTILMTVTLPCALLVSTRSLNMSAILLIPMGLGIAGNLLL